jgi:hypothetical protein
MHMRTQHTLATLSLSLAALTAWGGFIWFVRYINDQSTVRQAAAVDTAAQSVHDAAKLKLHAFARDTESVRATLDTSARVDVTSIARALAAAGRDAGVAVSIGDASTNPGRQVPGSLTPVTIIISADGTFGRLMLLESLLETVPVPIAIDSFALTHDTSAAGAPWHISVRVRALASLPSPAI